MICVYFWGIDQENLVELGQPKKKVRRWGGEVLGRSESFHCPICSKPLGHLHPVRLSELSHCRPSAHWRLGECHLLMKPLPFVGTKNCVNLGKFFLLRGKASSIRSTLPGIGKCKSTCASSNRKSACISRAATPALCTPHTALAVAVDCVTL